MEDNFVNIHIHIQIPDNCPTDIARGFQTLVIAQVGERTLTRYLDGRPSYLSTGEQAIHFGLGDADTIDELRIEWPRGYVTVMTNVDANRALHVTSPVVGDLNASGALDAGDLRQVLRRRGPVARAQDLKADLDGDGVVDERDVSSWLRRYRAAQAGPEALEGLLRDEPR